MSRIWSAVIGAALVGALGGCASQQAASPPAAADSSVASSSTAVASSTAAAPSSTAATTPPTAAPTSSSPAGQQLTLSGTVEEGVQHGCLLLTDSATGLRVNLTGGNAMVKLGAKVKVTGVIRKDLMSYCQQGAILEVLKASKD